MDEFYQRDDHIAQLNKESKNISIRRRGKKSKVPNLLGQTNPRHLYSVLYANATCTYTGRVKTLARFIIHICSVDISSKYTFCVGGTSRDGFVLCIRILIVSFKSR